MGKPIRVLLADDHSVLRAGLRLLLNAQPDMEVVGEAGDGEAAVQAAAELAPDVVLMDITMPGVSGLEATRVIRERHPEVKVLVLTMHDDDGYVAEAVAAGASGLVLKHAADTELLAAIRTVHAGRSLVFAGPTFASPQTVPWGAAGAGRGLRSLSQREREVMRYLALGYTNQEIGALLYLSVKTVETYKARVMEKLGVKRRADLVRLALQAGLIAPDR